MPELRFGAWSSEGRSHYWKVDIGASEPDVYLAREGFGDAAYISLHASGVWRLSGHVGKPIRRSQPDPSGVRRAAHVSIWRSACRLTEPERGDVHLLEAPDPPLCLTFTVLIAPPGTTEVDVGPDPRHVWLIPMSDGGVCVACGYNRRLDPPVFTFDAPPGLRRDITNGHAEPMFFSMLNGGGVWVVEGDFRFLD